MKKKTPKVYGYSICVVAIITFLITLAGLVNSIIDVSLQEFHQ